MEKRLIEYILKKVEEEGAESVEDAVRFICTELPVYSTKIKYALIQETYREHLRKNYFKGSKKASTIALADTAIEFDCSMSLVEKVVYKYRPR